MEKLAEVLLKLESKDAVEVANNYITFKYVELFTVTFLFIGILIGILIGVVICIKKCLGGY